MGRAVPYVAEAYYQDALHDMGEKITGKFDTKRAEAMLQDSYSHIAGATEFMSATQVGNLRNTVSRVLRIAGMTGMTSREVQGELLRLLTADFTFTDAKGRVWNTEAYTKMLARTTLMNAGRESYLDTCADKGKDVVRISISGDACPKCAEWENRLVSLSGKTKGLPLLQDAIDGGLFHPNCTHSTVAVGDWDRETNFDKNGRPKEGWNSAKNPNPKGDDPDANREYRKRQAEKAMKTDTQNKISKGGQQNNQQNVYRGYKTKTESLEKLHTEHVKHRQEQWERAYDRRRDEWYDSIIKAGGSEELAGTMADWYTPKVAKIGKPPKVKITKKERDTYYYPANIPKDDYIQMYYNPKNWFGCPDTAKHELTHWLHNQALRRGYITVDEVRIAAQKDFNKFIENCKNAKISLSDYKSYNIMNTIRQNMPYLQDCSNSSRIFKETTIADIIGSLTSGQYGRGHTVAYYKRVNNGILAQTEALANLKVIKNYLSKDIFPFDFSNLDGILKKIGG